MALSPIRAPLLAQDPSHQVVREADATRLQARREAFAQSVASIGKTMHTTPLGWALVLWLAHVAVPAGALMVWVGTFVPLWLFNLAALRRIGSRGSDPARYRMLLQTVAVLDGIGWGLLVAQVMGYDWVLDSWLVVVICGVASVNAPAYITDLAAFRSLIASIWLMVVGGVWISLGNGPATWPLILGISLYLGLLLRGTAALSRRVNEGIWLTIENAALARQLEQALDSARHEAATDALTGLPNRRSLNLALAALMEDFRTKGSTFSLLLLDIDHFKHINDVFGHAVGDQALQAFARRLRAPLRSVDVCARFGGEEFVVLLPRCTREMALEVAERLRKAVADTPLLQEPPLRATTSIGVALCQAQTSVEQLLAAADGAVYAAKRAGRNRVMLGDIDAGP